jgi:hypothetical protein
MINRFISKGYLTIRLKIERPITIAYKTFPAIEMLPVVIAMRKAGYVANGALAAKLWRRFSQDQCATWMNFRNSGENEISRFIEWIDSDMDNDTAWS